MISKPGFYSDISEAEYHGDPCPSPSLSNSVANILLSESAGHAWWAHPRLNRAKALEAEEATKTQAAGTLLHKLILGQGRPVKVLSFDSWRTNDSKKARDKAIEAGELPVLEKDMAAAEETALYAKTRIGRSDIASLLDDGEAEVTMAWQEDNGIWCRARLDWLPTIALEGGHITVLDLKTTGQSAHPEEWQRTMFDFGGDIQAAFYERGLRKLIPSIRTVDFRFVVIEQKAPWAVSLCRVGNEALDYAREAVDHAIRGWGALLKRGTALEHWPFYENETVDIDPPVWRKMAGELARMRMADRIRHWQRPLNPDKSQPA